MRKSSERAQLTIKQLRHLRRQFCRGRRQWSSTTTTTTTTRISALVYHTSITATGRNLLLDTTRERDQNTPSNQLQARANPSSSRSHSQPKQQHLQCCCSKMNTNEQQTSSHSLGRRRRNTNSRFFHREETPISPS